jgi:hypothetical protein
MPTVKVIFVHGTGGRKEASDERVNKIRTYLESTRHNVRVTGCGWVEAHGCRLSADGESQPSVSAHEPVPLKPQEARWIMLQADPLSELQALTLRARDLELGNVPYNPEVGDVEERDRLLDLLNGLCETVEEYAASRTAFVADLETSGLRGVLEDACRFVAKCPGLEEHVSRNALLSVRPPYSEYRDVLARAVVARAMNLRRTAGFDPAVHIDAQLRDRVLDGVRDALQAGTKGGEGFLPPWLSNGVLPIFWSTS